MAEDKNTTTTRALEGVGTEDADCAGRQSAQAAGGSPAQSANRERILLDAAEEVLTRWAIVRTTNGKLGACGMPEALRALDLACDAYQPEECDSPAAPIPAPDAPWMAGGEEE